MVFFFIGGVAPRVKSRLLAGVACPSCSRLGSITETRVDQVFSAFFVPLLTVKRGDAQQSCEACGWSSSASSAEAPPPTLPPPRPQTRAPELPPPRCCSRCGAPAQGAWSYCAFCGGAVR